MAIVKAAPNFGRIGVLILKIAVTVGLLALLFMHANVAKYLDIARGVPATTLVIVTAIVVFQMAVISAWRLKLVLASLGSSIDVVRASCITWCGFFVEQVGAVFVAGDLARMLLLRQVHSSAAIEGPLLDRVIGLLAIAAMAAFGLPVIWQELPERQRGLALAIIAGAALVIGLLAALLIVFLRRGTKLARARAVLSMLTGSIATVFATKDARKRIAVVVLLAFSTHCLNVIAMYLLLGAVGAKISLAASFMFTPTVMLVSMVPASISGWGVREGAFVVALQGLDIASEQVIAASVLFGLCVLAASLPGAVVWLSVTDRGAVSTKRPALGNALRPPAVPTLADEKESR